MFEWPGFSSRCVKADILRVVTFTKKTVIPLAIQLSSVKLVTWGKTCNCMFSIHTWLAMYSQHLTRSMSNDIIGWSVIFVVLCITPGIGSQSILCSHSRLRLIPPQVSWTTSSRWITFGSGWEKINLDLSVHTAKTDLDWLNFNNFDRGPWSIRIHLFEGERGLQTERSWPT